jgi:hypothetical protein
MKNVVIHSILDVFWRFLQFFKSIFNDTYFVFSEGPSNMAYLAPSGELV